VRKPGRKRLFCHQSADGGAATALGPVRPAGTKDFTKLSTITVETGAPIFADAMAYIDCRLVETVPGGDHDIFIGECVAGAVTGGEPLVFFNGNYTGLQASAFREHSQSEPIMLEDTYEYYGSF